MTDQDVKRLREVMQEADLTPEQREEAEALLAQAEEGDELARIKARELMRVAGYAPPLGEDPPQEPGPRYVCPQDPAHYAVYLTSAGLELICPEHEVALVPDPTGKG
ncbi:hypothetical protein FKZ61_005755 [Litorilinea aerophila]|uniref:Uncharacterized protein n=1 Tax=Litorilinea aerophila TaxID=1204385 RepID=A0A540VJ27_9CHLR|nr:hypothetical protein [Litorilinea aerophila]MCC9075616.1 hypothetical protein [Litorilinea aerophila]OUC04901.1 hypothetical protein RY27_30540 [Litorilinea aerophila]GIV79176.1 MAG: hypothetical protein KatS3mg050_3570 [Litorilinea sp.]